MAVLDAGLELADAQALASKSDTVSTQGNKDPIDTRKNVYKNAFGDAINAQIGNSVFNVGVNVALVGAGAAIRADLVSKADESISSGATVIASITIPAVAAAGWKGSIKISPGTQALRYMGVLFVASGAKLTSATLDSWLSTDHAEVYD